MTASTRLGLVVSELGRGGLSATSRASGSDAGPGLVPASVSVWGAGSCVVSVSGSGRASALGLEPGVGLGTVGAGARLSALGAGPGVGLSAVGADAGVGFNALGTGRGVGLSPSGAGRAVGPASRRERRGDGALRSTITAAFGVIGGSEGSGASSVVPSGVVVIRVCGARAGSRCDGSGCDAGGRRIRVGARRRPLALPGQGRPRMPPRTRSAVSTTGRAVVATAGDPPIAIAAAKPSNCRSDAGVGACGPGAVGRTVPG